MPIRADLRHFYRGPEWEAIRLRIMRRARWRCEQCRKPHLKRVRTITGRTWMFWCESMGWWTDENGVEHPKLIIFPSREILVKIGVCHLNHDPADRRDENLKAFCQWCHLNHDKLHHKESRATRKDSRRPLLGLCEAPTDLSVNAFSDAYTHSYPLTHANPPEVSVQAP